MIISTGYLRERLDYEPESGKFTWRSKAVNRGIDRYWNRRFSGQEAGRVNQKGYREITIDGRLYPAHRLAWLYIHGEWPTLEVDHIDRQRDNNQIANLRVASRCQNAWNKRIAANNSSGATGVVWHSKLNKWQAQIEVRGRSIYLGVFGDIEEAREARATAAKQCFGEWAGEIAP